jgi:hypothetical protein
MISSYSLSDTTSLCAYLGLVPIYLCSKVRRKNGKKIEKERHHTYCVGYHLLYPTCELLPKVKHKGKGLGFRV